MQLEKYRDTDGSPHYKLDGKRIGAKQANELLEMAGIELMPMPSTVEIVTKDFPDRLAAIKKAEKTMFTTFVIDHAVKVEDGIFAKDSKGSTMKLYDDRIAIKSKGVYMIYKLDVAESRFITELKAATLKALDSEQELTTLTITGNSGTIYTYDANTLEVIGTEKAKVDTPAGDVPAETTAEVQEELLVDYVIKQRSLARAEIEKDYREKKVA